MSNPQGAVGEPDALSATMSLEASDVTNTHSVDLTGVQRSLPAGAVARSVASMMGLPTNVPYALRLDSTSEVLRDDEPIGDQVRSGAQLSVIPKTHLG